MVFFALVNKQRHISVCSGMFHGELNASQRSFIIQVFGKYTLY